MLSKLKSQKIGENKRTEEISLEIRYQKSNPK